MIYENETEHWSKCYQSINIKHTEQNHSDLPVPTQSIDLLSVKYTVIIIFLSRSVKSEDLGYYCL